MADYLRNLWYVAGWEEEIVGSAWLPRRLLDKPRLVYRKQDGSGYVMVDDRCPHRFAPLRLGHRDGDRVVCRYHGLAFDGTGACVHAPFGPPPAHVRVQATPVVARHGLLWFWPGDPQQANPALIPDFSFLDGQQVFRRRSTFAGNYELLSDNLMDLSHVDFLHGATFGTQNTMHRATHEVSDGPDGSICSEWRILDAPKAPFLEAQLRGVDRIDQVLRMRWHAPASMSLQIHWTPSEAATEQSVFSMVNPHIITPESTSTSHYFWTCEANAESEALARAVFETEDRPMIEAVQEEMAGGEFWHLRPAILKQDLAAIRARRRLIKMRHEENVAAGQ